jgi:hypothetical protein
MGHSCSALGILHPCGSDVRVHAGFESMERVQVQVVSYAILPPFLDERQPQHVFWIDKAAGGNSLAGAALMWNVILKCCLT